MKVLTKKTFLTWAILFLSVVQIYGAHIQIPQVMNTGLLERQPSDISVIGLAESVSVVPIIGIYLYDGILNFRQVILSVNKDIDGVLERIVNIPLPCKLSPDMGLTCNISSDELMRKLMATLITDLLPAIVESDAKNINYYQQFITQLDDLKKIPFIGELAAPHLSEAENFIDSINKATDGALSNAFNSIMPCGFESGALHCAGSVDRDSTRVVAQKLVGLIPDNVMPSSFNSVLMLLTQII